ncbi:MAG TPA: hypothetical protein VH083_03580 [Myxococcales bacterium]|jgi:hypothetical protein|nr:hypothetical protein [Myxococcales bacterium]
MHETIEVGFQTFINDGPGEEFGSIRAIAPDHKTVTVYVENAGDFKISSSAIVSVQSEKVTFDCAKLDVKLREAIGHAHDREDS